jgi:hypothetical protein
MRPWKEEQWNSRTRISSFFVRRPWVGEDEGRRTRTRTTRKGPLSAHLGTLYHRMGEDGVRDSTSSEPQLAQGELF